LEAFSGIGGTTIKLANLNSISKVIANDHNKKRMGFLLNNLKVYEVDNKVQLSNFDFLKL
jgi:tRNA G37 N-methylase Trm5